MWSIQRTGESHGPTSTRGVGWGGAYRAVSFLDASEGWVVGDNGWIQHTTDGGATWQEMHHPSGLSLQAVVAAAPGVAYIGGQNGIILRYDATASAATASLPPHPRPAGKP